jgi:hypothetical protein
MAPVDVAIITLPGRPAPSVHSCLASFYASGGGADVGRITLIADEPEGHPAVCLLRDCYEHLGIAVEPRREPPGSNGEVRLSRGYARALAACDSRRPAIILEDDVTFASAWREHLEEIAAEAPAGALVWGYCRFPRSFIGPRQTVRRWILHPAGEMLWCNHLVRWPADPTLRAAGIARMQRTSAAADNAIGQMCFDQKRPVALAVPSLVDHLGDVSVIDPERRHTRGELFAGRTR